MVKEFSDLLKVCSNFIENKEEVSVVGGRLSVGPARRILRLFSSSHPEILDNFPSPLASALGVAALQSLSANPCPLPWVGSPEPADGVATAARRLIDSFVHGIPFPPARPFDVGIIIMAFALSENIPQSAVKLSPDAILLARAATRSLARAISNSKGASIDSALSSFDVLVPADVADATARLLLLAPPRSAAAERAAEQARFAELGQAKRTAAALNLAAAERRRMARGDWRWNPRINCFLVLEFIYQTFT